MKQTRAKHTHKLEWAKSSKINFNMLNPTFESKTSTTKNLLLQTVVFLKVINFTYLISSWDERSEISLSVLKS